VKLQGKHVLKWLSIEECSFWGQQKYEIFWQGENKTWKSRFSRV
jgi:hypothetical protein